MEWGTPPAIYEALDLEFGFTLDAAASGSNAKHVRYVAKDTDALAISWEGERVFCNPPYGRALKAWCEKALLEATEHNALVVMLIPARTDVRWFHDIVLPHAEIRFIRGRLNYVHPTKTGKVFNAPFASMVAVFRPGSRHEGSGKDQILFPFLSKGMP